MESVMNISNTNRLKFRKRLLTIVLCCTMILSGVCINVSDNVAEAATLNIPNTQFITKDEILKLCTETNSGKGLLATGTDTDVELRVNFGNRPEDVKCFIDTERIKTEIKAGELTWHIVGNEDNNTLIMYVERPIMSVIEIDSTTKSYFELDYDNKEYPYWYNPENLVIPDDGIYPEDKVLKEKVMRNHWGKSDIRKKLQSIVRDNENTFSNNEKNIMKSSRIITSDLLNEVNYATNDILYLPTCNNDDGDLIIVGQNDSVNINIKNWAGIHWLRKPIISYLTQLGQHIHVAVPKDKITAYGVNSKASSAAPAFALDVSHLRFASVGDGTATAKLEKITDDMAMNLRLGEGSSGYPFTENHKIKAKASEITYSAPKDSYLMFLAKDAKGQLYQYAKKIDANVTNATMSLTNIPGLDKGEDFSTKVWIEKKAGGTLSYATEPIDVYNVKSWGAVKDERVDHVIQYVDKEGKTSVEIKSDNLKDDTIWLKEESDDKSSWCGIEIPEGDIDLNKGLRFCIKRLSPNEKEYQDIYNQLDEKQRKKITENNGIIFKISVEDTDGNKVQLDKPIKLFIQMGEKWDAESLEAYLVSPGKNEKIAIDTNDLEDPEKKDSFAVMLLDYFTPLVVYPNKLIEEPVPESTKPPVVDNSNIENTVGNNINSNNNEKIYTTNKIFSPNTGETSTLGRIIACLKLMMASMGIMIIMYNYKKKEN